MGYWSTACNYCLILLNLQAVLFLPYANLLQGRKQLLVLLHKVIGYPFDPLITLHAVTADCVQCRKYFAITLGELKLKFKSGGKV